jgi:hypothetical protein
MPPGRATVAATSFDTPSEQVKEVRHVTWPLLRPVVSPQPYRSVLLVVARRYVAVGATSGAVK